MEFVGEYLLSDEDLTPDPLGAKVQQWATALPELEGSTTELGMRRSLIDDMLYCVNDDVYDTIKRDIEGYEEGKVRVRRTESRDFLRKRKDRREQQKRRKEKAAAAPPPRLDGVTSSQLLLRQQRAEEEEAERERRRLLRCGRPPCPCAEDPCVCPCPTERPCFVVPPEGDGAASATAAARMDRFDEAFDRQNIYYAGGGGGGGADDSGETDSGADGKRLYDQITGEKLFGINWLAEEFFKDSKEYQSRFRRDDNESPDILCPPDRRDLEDFFGYTSIYEPDIGAIQFSEWKSKYHALILRAFGTTREIREGMKADFALVGGRRPWYPEGAEEEEERTDRLEEEASEKQRLQLEFETRKKKSEELGEGGKALELADDAEEERMEEEEEEEEVEEEEAEEISEYATVGGRIYKLKFLQDDIVEGGKKNPSVKGGKTKGKEKGRGRSKGEGSIFNCRRSHGGKHFNSRQPLKMMPILDTKLLCSRLWRLDLSDLGLEIISGLGFFPFLGFLNLSNNNLDWKQLRNIHATGIIELYVCGNPLLEKEHYYRFHLLDALPKAWMIDGHFASTTERCKVATWFASKGLDPASPAYHKISVEGVFKTTAEKIVSEDPVGADFNPKAYACMGALPNYDKLIRSPCLDKTKLSMLKRELQEEVDRMLTRMFKVSSRQADLRRGIPADFLDRLEAEIGGVRLNFVMMLMVITGLFPIPDWLVKELLHEWSVTKLAGVDVLSLFRLTPKWRIRLVSFLLANTEVKADFGNECGMSPWLLDCLFCGVDWLIRLYLPRDVITTQLPEWRLKAQRKKETDVLASAVTQTLATEAALVLMATPKSLAWVLDNRDRENNIIIKQVKSEQDSQQRKQRLKKQESHLARQQQQLQQQRQRQRRQQLLPTRLWVQLEAREAEAQAEEQRRMRATSLRRICFFASGNDKFYRALRKIAFQTKDPDRVFKILIDYISAPKPDPIYKIVRGPFASMMDPLTYLKTLRPIPPRMDYEPRALKSSRLLAAGQSTVSPADRVDNSAIVASAELRRQQRHEKWLWERQLASKAGEEVFIEEERAGVVAAKPERHLAMVEILRPPEHHFTPARAPVDYPLRTTNFAFQNVSRLQKRMLELYDVWPYENEKRFVDGGWRLKEEDLMPRPKPNPREFGLPRLSAALKEE